MYLLGVGSIKGKKVVERREFERSDKGPALLISDQHDSPIN